MRFSSIQLSITSTKKSRDANEFIVILSKQLEYFGV